MIRSLLILALLVLTSASAAAQSLDAPDRPTLKAAATVTGEVVRIGDLIDNAGAVADVPIFRSPDLGQTGNVALAQVLEAVRGHHLLGLDTGGLSEVTVTRAARTITARDLEAPILHALAGKYGLPDVSNLAVAFDNEIRPLTVEATATAELAVTHLTFDPRVQRFDVTFELPGSTVARRLSLHFAGSLTETFATVVPTHEIAQGQVIQAADLAIERRAKASFTSSPLTTIADVRGLSAKHALPTGQVIRQVDVAKPELVGRNDIVTIVFEVPGILLTIVGKASEPGALGDVINVLNMQSKHPIQATVVGPDRVRVNAASARLAANTTP